MIRRAENSDLKPVGDLLEQVLRIHHEGRPDLFAGSGRKYTDEQLLELFKDDNAPVFVYDDGGVKGYVFCRFEEHGAENEAPHKSLYIDDLCVDEHMRGKHIGRQLYEFAKNYARETGCYNITLHVWECNTPAKRFYESVGMKLQYSSMEEVL